MAVNNAKPAIAIIRILFFRVWKMETRPFEVPTSRCEADLPTLHPPHQLVRANGPICKECRSEGRFPRYSLLLGDVARSYVPPVAGAEWATE